MTRTAEAMIEPDGTVRLLTPLAVAEPTRAVVSVVDPAAPPPAIDRPPPQTLEEALQGVKDAKTLEELFAAMDRAAPFETHDPEGYDLQKALEENRKQPWFRPVNLKDWGYEDE
ncbi:MAG: hypothetical protein JNK93_03155 [Planctomycetia bacterium]|nr:hypothetical protein [Planctomycetia bacterium]